MAVTSPHDLPWWSDPDYDDTGHKIGHERPGPDPDTERDRLIDDRLTGDWPPQRD